MGQIFTVYKGELNGVIVYIGTTIQRPADRFRWHKANKKDFRFTVLFQYNTSQEMLDKEFELIKLYNPKYNKITYRKQNLNVKLSNDVLNSRVNDTEWCQCCFKRRAKPGYKYCYWCKH